MNSDIEKNSGANQFIWDSFLKWVSSSKTVHQSSIDYEADKLLNHITLTKKQVNIVLNSSKYLMIKGGAGSGKSLSLLSRMIGRMIEEETGRYLYVTYNAKLIYDMYRRFRQSSYYKLIEDRHVEKENVYFYTFHHVVKKLLNNINISIPEFKTDPHDLKRSNDMMIRQLYRTLQALETEDFKGMPAIHKIKKKGNVNFLRDEFLWMKANNYLTEEDYIKCDRKGRGNLPWISREQRRTIFKLFQKYREEQFSVYHGRLDAEDYALKLIQHINLIPDHLKFDHVFIDEAQDLQPMQLYALALLTKGTLTISGDEKQKIYKNSPYSYRKLGIEIDRSNIYTLDGIFRSTKQIMSLANSLQFNREEDDILENENYNKNGLKPRLRYFKSYNSQIQFIIDDILKVKSQASHETVAIVHRFDNMRYENELRVALGGHFLTRLVDEKVEAGSGRHVYLTDAHSFKGLEFDHVYIINFDQKHYPHYSELSSLKKYNADSAATNHYEEDMKLIIEREKRVLYVALTRAKKTVTLSYHGSTSKEVSPFVFDFNPSDYHYTV